MDQVKVTQKIQKAKYLDTVKLFTRFKDEKVQTYITLILTFLSLIFFGLFAINPTLGTIAKLHRELEDTRSLNEQFEKKINDLSTLQQLYSSMEAEIDLLKLAFPQAPEAPRFLAQIQSLAQQANVTIVEIEAGKINLIGDQKNTETVFSYTFDITAEGSEEQLRNFYTTVSKLLRITTFETLSLTFSEEDQFYVLSLRGNVYLKH